MGIVIAECGFGIAEWGGEETGGNGGGFLVRMGIEG